MPVSLQEETHDLELNEVPRPSHGLQPLLTHLDAIETSLREPLPPPDDPDQADKLCIHFRHSHWAARRLAVFNAMLDAGLNPRRTHRFAVCGAHAWVQRSIDPPHRYRVVSSRCRDRWCEPCQREYRQKLALNLLARVPGDRLRFCTLTLRSNPQHLKAQIRRLYDCFARFRRDKRVKAAMAGGVVFLELTRSALTGFWHPHLHILFSGAFLAKEVARNVWHRITGDSYIVDLRIIRNLRAAAGYVLQYASKIVPADIDRSSPVFAEIMASLDAVRTVNVFGTWRGFRLAHSDPSDTAWEYLAPLPNVIADAHAGDTTARGILYALFTPDAAAGAARTFGEAHAPPPF